ncbi:protein containing Prepilin-type cleavage/methylation [Candidatus Magnetobacterium bavaricum]|uniref:Protein containing Prepilin-type cleavage/methylation n=1 Tax=Candidatus Magnetobacterium bavaricum TaxID=29290 RepID=A0A0F3GZP6_9BACT|nr:protein containing Prepilin-type cleavage/methylation [Candidatus Magnetobacterium bavaricum]
MPAITPRPIIRDESGFTLVELLIVIAITVKIPMRQETMPCIEYVQLSEACLLYCLP